MDAFSKHSTNLEFIECVVVRNKVVSSRKAHVEIPKVERFRMREGSKGVHPGDQKTPFCDGCERSDMECF